MGQSSIRKLQRRPQSTSTLLVDGQIPLHQLRTWNVQMLSHRGHLHGVAAKINGYRERQRSQNTFDNVTLSKMCCSLNQGLAVHLGYPRTCYPGKWCFFNPVGEEKQRWQAKPDEVLWLVPIRFTSSGSCDSIMIALSEDFALPMSVKRDQGGGTVQFNLLGKGKGRYLCPTERCVTAQIWDRSACDYCAGNAESWEGKAGRIFRAIHSPVGEQDGEMAYVLSQMPVHCGTRQLLKEPDVLPKFTYLFDKEFVHETTEESETACTIKLQENSGEEKGEIIIDVVSYQDPETAFHVKPQENDETVDKANVFFTEVSETNSDVKLEMNNDEDEVIDIISCEVSETNFDDKLEVNNDEDEVIDIISCEAVEESGVTSDTGVKRNKPPKIKEFSIPLQKLRVTTNCITTRPELEEDEYIFCSDCDKLRIGDCPMHGGLTWIKEPTAMSEKEGLTKARSTIPRNMDLKISSIPDAGLGIFAKERFESDVVFGPYWGQKIGVADLAPNLDQSYMWDIIENGRVTHVVDARDEQHSNWLRFVNCARNEDEQNLVAFQFRGEIYYRTYKTIEPGMELLVWYGDKYACDLAILNKDASSKMEDGPIQCQKCFMVCSGPVSFANHNKFRCQLNNDQHLWRCMHCDRSFKTQKSLHFHKNIHKGLKPFTCWVCGKVFAFRSSKRRHINQMHSGAEKCSCKMCSNVYDDENRLRHHERTFHAVKRFSNGSFECVECKKRFAEWKHLQRHRIQKEHSDANLFSCNTCGKVFRKRQNLLRHEAFHKPAAPYKCQQCGRCFLSSSDLSNHVKVHVNKAANRSKSDKDVNVTNSLSNDSNTSNSFDCEICTSRFTYSFNYARHMREKHPQVKIIKCHKCAKVCIDERRLAIHMAIKHQKVKGDATLHRSNSEKDLKPSDRMYRCDICAKEFVSSYSLHSHKGHHRRKLSHNHRFSKNNFLASPSLHAQPSLKSAASSRLSCKVCNKSFPTTTSLRSHISHHTRTSYQMSFESSHLPTKCSPESSKSRVGDKSVKFDLSTKEEPNGHTSHHSGNKLFGNKSFGVSLSSSSSQARQKGPQNSKRLPGSSLPSGLKESASSVSPRKQFTCEVCGKGFRLKKSLSRHKGHHSRKNSKKCSPSHRSSNKTKPVVGANMQNKHVCNVCFQSFQSSRSLSRHKRAHVQACSSDETKPVADANMQNKHICNVCFQSFQSSRSLSQHKRLHAGINTVCVCSFCHRGYSSKFSLMRHKLRHHADRPYKCKQCGTGFPTVMGRDRHLLYKHGSSATPEKKCSLPLTPVQPKSRTFGTGKFRCKHCNMRFRSYNGRYRHIRKCHADCISSFQPKETYSFQRMQTKNGTWKCQHCSKEFQSVSGLKKHVNKKHAQHLHQECKPEGKDGNETTGAERTQTCRRCKVRFCTFKSGKRCYCTHCSRELQRKFKSSGLPFKESSVNSTINENVKSIRQKRNLNSRSMAVRAFQCQYCQEGCSTINSLYKHMMIVHQTDFGSNPCVPDKPLDNQSEHEAGYNTNIQGLQPKSCPWKCHYCIKKFQSASSLKRHVKNKHKRKTCVSEENNRNEVSSNTAERTQTCHRCKVRYSNGNSRRCVNCSEGLPIEKNADESQFQERRNLPHRPAMLSNRHTARAFMCQYCQKGFSTINSLYKHMMIAHQKDFLSSRHGPNKPPSTQFVSGYNNTTTQRVPTKIAPWKCEHCSKRFQTSSSLTYHVDCKHIRRKKSNRHRGCTPEGRYSNEAISRQVAKVTQTPPITTRDTVEIVGKCEKGHGSASGLNSQLTKKKFKTVENKMFRTRIKRGNLTTCFRCRQCGKRFLTQSGRRKHMTELHEKKNGSCERNFTAIYNCKDTSYRRTSSNRSLPKRNHSTAMAFPCEHCPKKFSCLGSRYKHVMLVHSRENTSSPSNVCQLKPNAPVESSARSDEKLLPSNDSNTMSSSETGSAAKRKASWKAPIASSDCKKARRLKDKSEKPNGRVSSQKDAISINGSTEPSESLVNAIANESLSRIPYGNPSKQCRSSLQGDVVHQCTSVGREDNAPYKCGICCTTLTTKRDLAKHTVTSINGLSRPALRTITCLQNNNTLKSLRSRHGSCIELTL